MAYLLTLNTGSSSVKFRLFNFDDQLNLLAGGKVTDIGGKPEFKAFNSNEKQSTSSELESGTTHEQAVTLIIEWLEKQQYDIKAVAHRIVHGGERFTRPAKLNDETLTYLHSLESLAPLHQPHNLSAVNILKEHYPHLLQFGCFDTAFHANHSPLFHEFALPQSIRDQGVKRYGFHGLSYDWIAHCLKKDYPKIFKAKVVVAHLGNGASLCALKEGKSIDTTMGMTALDGLPMGTRCGALDAGAVIYMIRDLGLSISEVEHLLYNESGLKGLSNLTNDVKSLSESDDINAQFALNFFTLKTAQYIAAMSVSLGGLDALIFTGGIGENAENIRDAILQHLAFLPTFEHYIIQANEEHSMAVEILENFKEEIINE